MKVLIAVFVLYHIVCKKQIVGWILVNKSLLGLISWKLWFENAVFHLCRGDVRLQGSSSIDSNLSDSCIWKQENSDSSLEGILLEVTTEGIWPANIAKLSWLTSWLLTGVWGLDVNNTFFGAIFLIDFFDTLLLFTAGRFKLPQVFWLATMISLWYKVNNNSVEANLVTLLYFITT